LKIFKLKGEPFILFIFNKGRKEMPLVLLYPEALPYRSIYTGEFKIPCCGVISYKERCLSVSGICISNKINGEYDGLGYRVEDVTISPKEEWSEDGPPKNLDDPLLVEEITKLLNEGKYFDDVVEMWLNMKAIAADVINGEVKVVAEEQIEDNIYVICNLYFNKKDGVYDNQGWWISDLALYKPVEGGYTKIYDTTLIKRYEQYILDGDFNKELIEPYLNEERRGEE
jgi:hypothetical protein